MELLLAPAAATLLLLGAELMDALANPRAQLSSLRFGPIPLLARAKITAAPSPELSAPVGQAA